MCEVAIIGAGELGGAIAFQLARLDAARTVRLIDESGTIARGKALDIAQAAPIVGFSTTVLGATTLFESAAARILVIADQAAHEPGHDESLGFLRRLTQLSSDSIVVCAGAGQRELVEVAARERLRPRERILGSAPEALASAMKALVALEANGSPADVSLTVLGVPPDQTVVPWEDATIAGTAMTRVLSDTALRRLGARIALVWPPGPVALAAAAALVVQGILGRVRQRVSVFIAPDDSQGRRTRAAALPVYLGWEGIERIDSPALTAHDRVALENAMTL
jgi:malate dehydrogenase